MELRQYISFVWKWLWLFVLATAIAAGASYYYTSRQPKIYEASAKLLVGQTIESTNPNPQDIFTSQQLALTYIQIAKTTPVLQAALENLGLKMTPDQLSRNVNASIINGTQLIEVRVIDVDPTRAQALANELARQLTLQGPAKDQQDQSAQRQFMQAQVIEIQKKISDATKTVADLQSSIQVTSSAREIADKQAQVTTLQQQINQWQQTYATLVASLGPRSPNILSVIEPAELPRTPIAPNVPMNALLAAAIGLMLAIGAALTLDYLDDTVKTAADATKALGLSTLGTITSLKGRKDHNTLITESQPRSGEAEMFRVLRTNVQFTGVGKPVKSLLVTSANELEGKSTTAANLAIVMAQAGLRTVLVDADLRDPSQHRLFSLPNDTGLTTGLLLNATGPSLLRTTKVENLRVLTSGPIPPNPAELAGSEVMRSFAGRLEGDADIVIFDGPPALAVSDAAILARMVDGVLLVVDARKTRREAAVRAKQVIEQVGGRILGVVINRANPRAVGYPYYASRYFQKGNSKEQALPAPAQQTPAAQ